MALCFFVATGRTIHFSLVRQSSILAQVNELRRPFAGGCGGSRRGGAKRANQHTAPDERPIRCCPAGHTLKPFTASVHNCDICSEHVFPGTKVFGCRECNYDACGRCYATLPGRESDESGGGMSELAHQLSSLHISEAITASSNSGCRVGSHRFISQVCMVCKGCGCCTGFGRACLLHEDGRTRGEPCGCGGGDSGCVDCGLCKTCAGQGSPLTVRPGATSQQQGNIRERSTFTVHVGANSYKVESTAASLAEFKSMENMRSLRRDFAAKLGTPVADLPEIQIDESSSMINPRAPGLSYGNRRTAERIIENHKVEWLRVAQLAVPEVAKATGPRFCDGGAASEKAVVCEHLLSVRFDSS